MQHPPTAVRATSAAVFLALSPSLHAGDISGSIGATSDYVFRGISQTQGHPAPQGGIGWTARNGAYASLWASRVDYAAEPRAFAEVDAVLGWGTTIDRDWAADLNLTWFRYPSTTADLDYVEVIATAVWRDRAWVMVGWSPDVFATGRTGTYAQVGTRMPLGGRGRLEVAAGHYGLGDAYGRSYAHGQATYVYPVTPRLQGRLSFHATDAGARAIFGDPVAGTRVEAALQLSF